MICPLPSPTLAASSSSACVKAEPFQFAPTIDGKLVAISIANHLCVPCAGTLDGKATKSSKSPLTVIELPTLLTATAPALCIASANSSVAGRVALLTVAVILPRIQQSYLIQ